MENSYSEWSLAIEWGRGSRSLNLEWKILDHSVSFFWLKLIHSCLSQGLSLKSRYVGFLEGPRDQDFVGGLLNECIEAINYDGRYRIEERYRGIIDQKLLNQVHHHFSVLIGNEAFKSDYWKASNRAVRSAVCGLNDYVHELESWQRAEEAGRGAHAKEVAYVTSEFFEAKGIEMQAQWDDLFSLDGSFGDLTVHYDQIGKTWLEVMIDQDEVIIPEDIRPLSILTGSFNINFFETNREQLLNIIRPYAQSKGIDLEDKQLRLGQCCLGHLQNKVNNQKAFVDELSQQLEITAISLLKNGRCIIRKSIPASEERYFYEK